MGRLLVFGKVGDVEGGLDEDWATCGLRGILVFWRFMVWVVGPGWAFGFWVVLAIGSFNKGEVSS